MVLFLVALLLLLIAPGWLFLTRIIKFAESVTSLLVIYEYCFITLSRTVPDPDP
jgi:hypothetical protein